MKINFQQKLVFSFVIIFILFTAGIVVFEQTRAKRYKTEALQERLDAYADALSRYTIAESANTLTDSLMLLLPDNMRVTLIDRHGNVSYDNAISDPSSLDNHSDRPEVTDAIRTGSGTFIRTSASNNRPYMYYAKDSGNGTIVRVALPYDVRVRSFLKPDNAFLYFAIALFVVGIAIIYYLGRHFGKSVRDLRDFSLALGSGNDVAPPEFADDEFGQIGRQLVHGFDNMKAGEKQLALEREKLLLHIQTSAEGICFFNPDRTVAFYNGLFMQYFGMISESALVTGRTVLNNADFADVSNFLDNHGNDNYFESHIGRHGKEFLLRLNIFENDSFEIILIDVTSRENSRRLKHEMTGNIAHELRTPVTSIRGFLEILLNNELSGDKAREYLERAYSQTITLSDLISDMGLLTRIDGKQDAFEFSDVDINRLLEKVYADTSAKLSEKNITFKADIPKGLTLKGNESLLYSVFRNLTDNVISHAGKDAGIHIGVNGIKDGMVYFSFSDTGKGIEDEKHLPHLFERFYRINEGRTRDTGGSGLGLSIVKNAVQFHGGAITVRNAEKGGLEFLFTVSKGE